MSLLCRAEEGEDEGKNKDSKGQEWMEGALLSLPRPEAFFCAVG